MFGIENFLAFLLAATLIIIIPGPATFFVMGKAHLTFAHAVFAALGIIIGDVALITVSGLGFSSLIARFPLLLMSVKIGGALYVLYLGLALLKSGSKNELRNSLTKPAQGQRFQAFVRGILITLTNPKPILFFSTFFPMFIMAGTKSVVKSFYLLGMYFEILNLSYFCILLLIVTQLQQLSSYNRFIGGGFKSVSGVGLLCCGTFILVTSFR
ncbi:LysE family translocator [Solimicrobium silvestre]|uniref:Putative threonine efflux protein n=1 Tax=Solimicrobium silvestre TaxID=2099400 RepID=A0A2S9H4Z6_9BURK|nr:LysE family transporter [Solimicrobium silvestre]PRC95011.1 putative threonine efflux protein [Solimicrobium silvestre]